MLPPPHNSFSSQVDRNEEQHGEVPTWKVADFKKASGIARFLYRLYRTPFVMFVVLPQYVFSLSYRWQPDSLICNTLIALRCAILFLINPSLLWVEFWATFLSNSVSPSCRLFSLHLSLPLWLPVEGSPLASPPALQIGFYLFFGQHTFNPFMEQTHANYNVVKAGIYSSSFFVMHPILHWVRGSPILCSSLILLLVFVSFFLCGLESRWLTWGCNTVLCQHWVPPCAPHHCAHSLLPAGQGPPRHPGPVDRCHSSNLC